VTEAGRMLIDNDLTEISDDHLIMAILTGDDEAFSWLVARHKRRVFSLAARFARDRHELEDISQEVFIKAFENLKAFRHEAPFEHWLSRITVRACYDFLRRIRREKSHTSLEDLVYELRDQTHEARQAAREAHELLAWAMSKMRPEERLIITLLELEEKPVSEIAELTGWSESNVKVRAFRARQALKTILEKKMKGNAERRLDNLFAAARPVKHDTSAAEEFFETRLMARIRENRERLRHWFSWVWRLTPAFMAVALVLGVFSLFMDESQSLDIFSAIANDHAEYQLINYLGEE